MPQLTAFRPRQVRPRLPPKLHTAHLCRADKDQTGSALSVKPRRMLAVLEGAPVLKMADPQIVGSNPTPSAFGEERTPTHYRQVVSSTSTRCSTWATSHAFLTAVGRHVSSRGDSRRELVIKALPALGICLGGCSRWRHPPGHCRSRVALVLLHGR